MNIAHMHDDRKPKPATEDIEQISWQLIHHPLSPGSDIKVANLVSVSWLDVAAMFRDANAPSETGRYSVHWRINLNGSASEAVVAGTEFRAIVFNKNEDPLSDALSKNRTPDISFKPTNVQELMQHTDRPGSVPGRPKNLQEAVALQETPGYNPNVQGFFTLTLPGELDIEGGNVGGVLVQIQNHSRRVITTYLCFVCHRLKTLKLISGFITVVYSKIVLRRVDSRSSQSNSFA
ncbi:hypothetical protein BC939DRAFT_105763 [Gamsiella multidivaricata]|uniref:uncharacterized protein n=1 Tax=Gamsiella multidivaricata TaxID=101098 RepID=UPI0022211A10|nr:uncharacterized protein BC939DRAFT_105763 [Gamsiella multidivaricata]KAI7832510.1 hypothetical protein BC939DRAFT_105763 [Gamsiella multidivaricata]